MKIVMDTVAGAIHQRAAIARCGVAAGLCTCRHPVPWKSRVVVVTPNYLWRRDVSPADAGVVFVTDPAGWTARRNSMVDGLRAVGNARLFALVPVGTVLPPRATALFGRTSVAVPVHGRVARPVAVA
ncbi:MAG: hypothetical protein ACRC7O_00715, partial [Fimbriiglobus sp.]